MAQTQQLNFQILIEEDKVQGDFIAYIPAIRLGSRGNSLEEVRENAKDLLQMEIEIRRQQGKDLPTDDTAVVEHLSIALPALN